MAHSETYGNSMALGVAAIIVLSIGLGFVGGLTFGVLVFQNAQAEISAAEYAMASAEFCAYYTETGRDEAQRKFWCNE